MASNQTHPIARIEQIQQPIQQQTSKTRTDPRLRSAIRGVIESLESRQMLTTFTVTSAAGVHEGGLLTLREAIDAANANAGVDTINFAISGSGVHTITIDSGLTVTDAVVIDGYTQTGASRNTKAAGSNAVLKIELQASGGPGAPVDFNLLTVAAAGGGSTISGIAFGSSNFSFNPALELIGGNNVVSGNFIGLDATGTVARKLFDGISIAGSNNLVGGATPGDRNVVTGLSNGIDALGNDNRVLNNYVGTDLTGTVDLAGTGEGFVITGTGNMIGGDGTGEGNLISGWGDGGVFSDGSSQTTLQGNLIGTDVTGKNTLGNNIGVAFYASTDALIGGTTPGAGNVIAFNDLQGVRIYTIAGNPNEYSQRVSVLSNSIFKNGGLGIELVANPGTDYGVTPNDTGDADAGPNGLTNFPVLSGAYIDPIADTTIITGNLNALANTTYTVQFFVNPASEAAKLQAHTFIGRTTVTTDGSGNAVFAVTLDGQVPLGSIISSTATVKTDAGYQETSEISAGATVTALPDGPEATFTFDNIVEGNSGTKQLVVTVTLAAPALAPASFKYATFDASSALAGQDYVAESGKVTFAVGQTIKTFNITINGDTIVEPDETFGIAITEKTNLTGIDGLVPTILNDDAPPTPTDTVQTLQGEDAVLAKGTAKKADHAGYTGTGFADFGGRDSSAQWTLNRVNAGSAIFDFRYANGGTSERPLNLFVNGVVVAQLPCPSTGTWTHWSLASLSVSLNAGANIIKLVAAGNAGGANIDKLTVTPVAAPPPPPPTGSISGVAFNDNNKNTKYDSGDGASKGITVFLDTNNNGVLDGVETSILTNATTGRFTFTGLGAGTYHVRRTFPTPGYTYSTAPIDVTLAAGQAKTGTSLGTKKV